MHALPFAANDFNGLMPVGALPAAMRAVPPSLTRYPMPRALPAELNADCLGQVLEQLDHGVALLGTDGRVLYANRVAQRSCGADELLRLQGAALVARRAADEAALARALASARRGLRTMLAFEDGTQSLTVLVMPLPTLAAGSDARPDDGGGRALTLLLFGRRHGCELLHVDMFARARGLTLTECAVLKGLCSGLDPASLAQRQGVRLSTVRTQINSIRQKTRTGSIRQLLSLVHSLPPVVSALSLMN